MKKYIGVHLIAEFWSIKNIKNKERVEKILKRAARESGNKPLKFCFYAFQPQGFTAILILEESHISIHTWPEYNYAAVDIFTCGENTSPQKAIEILKKFFKPQKVEIKIFKRGKLIT